MDTVLDLAKAAVPPGSAFGQRSTRMFGKAHPQFLLIDDAADKFGETVHRLLDDVRWSEHFSEAYCSEFLEILVRESLAPDASATALIARLQEKDATHREWRDSYRVHLPVQGIHVQVGTVTLGNVTLREVTQQWFDDLIAEISAISSRTIDPPAWALDHIKASVGTSFSSASDAESRWVAEPTRVRQLAEEETRKVLDLFFYFAIFLYPEDYPLAIGLVGDVRNRNRNVPIIRSDNEQFTIIGDIGQPLLTIDSEFLAHAERLGLSYFDDLLKRQGMSTEIEAACLRSVHWIAEAERQDSLENKILCFSTALETLLTRSSGEPIGVAIAEGVALLLGTSFEERRILKKTVRDLYGRRSAISHGGGVKALQADVLQLRRIAADLVRHVLERRDTFRKKQDLFDWIEEEKLSPPRDRTT